MDEYPKKQFLGAGDNLFGASVNLSWSRCQPFLEQVWFLDGDLRRKTGLYAL